MSLELTLFDTDGLTRAGGVKHVGQEIFVRPVFLQWGF